MPCFSAKGLQAVSSLLEVHSYSVFLLKAHNDRRNRITNLFGIRGVLCEDETFYCNKQNRTQDLKLIAGKAF